MSSRASASPRRPPVPPALGGVVLGLLAGTAAQCLAWLFGTPAVTTVGLVLGAAAAASVATATTAGGTAVAALLCWALDDGFALHRFGELDLAAADRHALVGIILAAAAAHGIAVLVRAERVAGGRQVRRGHLERLITAPHWVPAVGSRGRLWS
jgi:hypothetical protein